MSDLFKVRVGVVLIQDNRILLVRQNNRPFWVFPGGTLEQGETLEECAVRELKEEANFTIRIQKLLYLANFMHPVTPAVDVFFLAEILAGSLQQEKGGNINEISFFGIQELSNISIEPSLIRQQVLKDWQNRFLQEPGGIYLGQYAPH